MHTNTIVVRLPLRSTVYFAAFSDQTFKPCIRIVTAMACSCCGTPDRTVTGCSCKGGRSHVCKRQLDMMLAVHGGELQLERLLAAVRASREQDAEQKEYTEQKQDAVQECLT